MNPRRTLMTILGTVMAVSLLATAQAQAAPDRVKVEPDLYFQNADTLPGSNRPAGSLDPSEMESQRSGTKIVGGAPTTISAFPWQTALAYNDEYYPGNGFDRQFCGGTLVAPNVVITAAHCVYDDDGEEFYPASDFESITGRTYLSSTEGQAIDWAKFYILVNSQGNPAYSPTTHAFDVVFAVLESNSSATPIQIAGRTEAATWAAGQPAFVSGWGDLAEGGKQYPDQLHAARVAMSSDSSCGAAYASFNNEVMVCAAFPGRDTCQGDSGGPLVVPVQGGSYRLVGDTSFGAGCARAGYPGVYGRIAGGTRMGNVLENAILARTGHNVYGSGAQPLAAPTIQVTGAPKPVVKSRKRKVKVSVAWSSSDSLSTFSCQIDGGEWTACSTSVTQQFARGKHTVSIVATNFIGDPGPATTVAFKVKRKRKRSH